MTISTKGNHLKSCNNNQPLHHEKTAPRPARPPTDHTPKNWLANKEGNSTGRDVGRCPVLGISLALILLPLVSSDPPSHSTFSVFSLPGPTIGLPGAEILFWERFVLDHELFGKDCYWAIQDHSRKGPNYSSGWRFSVAVVLVCFSSAPNQNMAPRASLFGHFQSGPRERFW